MGLGEDLQRELIADVERLALGLSLLAERRRHDRDLLPADDDLDGQGRPAGGGGVVVVWAGRVVVVAVVPPRSACWGTRAAASVDSPSRMSITMSRRRAAIRGEVERHGALNDMAAVVLDASLVALLGVVAVSDLRTRLVPDSALAASLAVALPVCLISEPGACRSGWWRAPARAASCSPPR